MEGTGRPREGKSKKETVENAENFGGDLPGTNCGGVKEKTREQVGKGKRI